MRPSPSKPATDPILQNYQKDFRVFCFLGLVAFQIEQNLEECRVHLKLFPDRLNEVFVYAIDQKNPSFAWFVYEEATPEIKAKIISEMSLQAFQQFGELRKEKRGPTLEQGHLNEQMAKYAEKIGRPQSALCIRNQDGFCFAWSHSEAVLSVLYRGDWWDAARLLLSLWDGGLESLDSMLKLPGDNEPKALKEIFGIMVGSQLKTQVDEQDFPYNSLDFTPGQGFRWVDGKEFFTRKEATVCEEFTVERMKELLTTPEFRSLEDKGYVTVETSLHATHYQVMIKPDGSKTYRVFDSNDPSGRLSSTRLTLAAETILQQGSALSLAGVRVLPREASDFFTLKPDSKVALPEKKKFTVTQPEFLPLLFRLTPEELKRTLIAADTPSALWAESCSGYYKGVKEPVVVPFLIHAIMREHGVLAAHAIKEGARLSAALKKALELEEPLFGYFFTGLLKLLPEILKKMPPLHCGLVFRDLVELLARKKGDKDYTWRLLDDFFRSHMKEDIYCTPRVACFFKSVIRSAWAQRPGLVAWYLFSGFCPLSDLRSKTVFALQSGSIEDDMRKLGQAIFDREPQKVGSCLARHSLAQLFEQRSKEPFNFELLQRLVDVLNSRGTKPTKGILAPYIKSLEDLEVFKRLLSPPNFLEFLGWVGPEKLSELPSKSIQNPPASLRA